jgi:hypothetical protein
MNRTNAKALCGLMIAAWCGLGTTACGGDDDDEAVPTPGKAHIEIQGTWGNATFMETDAISDTEWSSAFGDDDPTVSTIAEFDNGTRYAIVQGPDGGTFSYTVWTKPEDDTFYYCSANYFCPTAEAARNGDDSVEGCSAPTFDETADLDTTGCGVGTPDSPGGFSWTKLTKQ